MRMCGLFGCLLMGFAIEELFFFLLLLLLCWAFRIERLHPAFLCWRQLRHVPDEQDQLPAVVVFLLHAPGRHSSQSDTVVDDVVKISVGQPLGPRQAHVWSFWVYVLTNFGFAAAIVGVADGTMIGEVSPRL